MFQLVDAVLFHPALGSLAGRIPAKYEALVPVTPVLDHRANLVPRNGAVQPFFPPARAGRRMSREKHVYFFSYTQGTESTSLRPMRLREGKKKGTRFMMRSCCGVSQKKNHSVVSKQPVNGMKQTQLSA